MSVSKYDMYNLDWIQILKEAIEMRKTSWNWEPCEFTWKGETKKMDRHPVREWRNASDEIAGAVIRAMEKKGMIDTFVEKQMLDKLKRE